MEQKPLFPTAIKFGMLTSLGVIVLSLIFYLMGLTGNNLVQWFVYIILIIGIVLGIKHHKNNDLDGFISYGRALGCGTLISLNAGIIAAIYTYILFAFIDPDLVNTLLSQIEQQMYEQGNSEQEIEIGMRYTTMFMTPTMMAIMVIFMDTFIGFVSSLIIAAIFKKEKPVFNTEE